MDGELKGRSLKDKVAYRAAIAVTIICALMIAYFRSVSRAVIERGDGVQHYLFARWSWSHPDLFLHAWAKPLFTLLASPWAQCGHIGVAIFNIVVAVLTVFAALPVLRGAGKFALVAYPLLLFSAPLYVEMLMAGMTEPLFGLLTVVCVSLVHGGRPGAAAVTASFMPFSRPEFIAFMPVLLVWLIVHKQWRQVPLLLIGPGTYALVGWLTNGDPLWFVHQDPYPNGPSRYGSGDPWMFTRQLDDICGRPLMVMFIVGLAAYPIMVLRSKATKSDHVLFFLAAVPATAILTVHMFLWAKGVKASAGILRVITTGIPMAALFATSVVPGLAARVMAGRASSRWITWVLLGVLAMWCLADTAGRRKLPIQANADEEAILRVSDRIATMKGARKLFTTHPYLALSLDLDPQDDKRFEMTYGADALLERMKPGDLIFWDSELGPVESQIPLERLMTDDRLRLVMKEEPNPGHKVIHDVYYELYLFERAPAHRSMDVDTLFSVDHTQQALAIRVDTLAGSEPAWRIAPKERALVINDLPRPEADAIFDEWTITMRAQPNGGVRQQWLLVYEQLLDGKVTFRRQEELYGGAEEIHLRVTPMPEGVVHRFRSSDPMQLGGTIEDLRVVRARWKQAVPVR